MKKFVALLASIILIISMFSAVAFADTDDDKTFPGDGDVVFDLRDQYAFPLNQHDVFVDGEPKTIYCMQQRYLWPEKGETQYTEATDINHLPNIDDDKLQILRMLLFAGYPNNGAGLLNENYEKVMSWGLPEEDAIKSINYELAEITQIAVWMLMCKWEVPGNYWENADYPGYDNLYGSLDSVTKSLIDYALNTKSFEVPKSTVINVIGDRTLTVGDDGLWHSGALSVAAAENASLNIFTALDLPEGVTAVDANGNTVTHVFEGETFYLVSESDTATLNVTADYTYPTEVSHYMTNGYRIERDRNNGGQEFINPFQTMLSVDSADLPMSGRAAFSAPAPDPVNPTVPKTGDGTPVASLMVMLTLAGVGMVVLGKRYIDIK